MLEAVIKHDSIKGTGTPRQLIIERAVVNLHTTGPRRRCAGSGRLDADDVPTKLSERVREPPRPTTDVEHLAGMSPRYGPVRSSGDERKPNAIPRTWSHGSICVVVLRVESSRIGRSRHRESSGALAALADLELRAGQSVNRTQQGYRPIPVANATSGHPYRRYPTDMESGLSSMKGQLKSRVVGHGSSEVGAGPR